MPGFSRHVPPHQAMVSMVILAYDEAGDIAQTVAEVTRAMTGRFRECEIIVVDDGSTDGTGGICDELATADGRIIVLHNDRNRGMGYSYQRGVAAARGDYVAWTTGDNSLPAESFQAAFDRIGEADLIVTYQASMGHRPLTRRLISAAYMAVMRAVSGHRLRYFNGPNVLPRQQAQSTLPLRSQGFSAISEMLVRLLGQGCTVVEVGVVNLPRRSGKTKAFRIRNILSVSGSVLQLFWDVRIRRRRYGSRADRDD